jgi:putative hemolysin
MRLPGSFWQLAFFDYTAHVRAQLHRFLLLLLMLALPLQTFASAAMQSCMAPHPVLPEQVAMADAMMADCHEHKQSDSAPAQQHNCKHCAVCALASALPVPAAADTLAIVPATTRFISHPAASFSGFIPDGPERPPRTSLA